MKYNFTEKALHQGLTQMPALQLNIESTCIYHVLQYNYNACRAAYSGEIYPKLKTIEYNMYDTPYQHSQKHSGVNVIKCTYFEFTSPFVLL